MSARAGRVAVIANAQKEAAPRLAEDIAAWLAERGREADVVLFDGTPIEPPRISDAALVMTLGGDGTVLYASRLCAPYEVPVLPVNLGSLGFIAWVKPAEWKARLSQALDGALPMSERVMLDVSIKRDGLGVASFSALNDAVVTGSGPAKLISLSINVSRASLGTYRSDGVIVSTPTGSTAYSLAAGGPILDPDMDALLFNPICPFTLSNRPLVIPGDEVVEIYVERKQRESIALTIDGQESVGLEEADRVYVRRSAHRARLFCAGRGSFYQVLRAKLNWSGGPDA